MDSSKSTTPYKDQSANLIYNLLFCDDLDLYKENTPPPLDYPFNILFSDTSSADDLLKITNDPDSDPRIKLLAYNKLTSTGQLPEKKELLAVIVEVGLDDGLDVLASFVNGTARYINHTGKILIWETTDETSTVITSELFSKSRDIVNRIGPWDNPRRPAPATGNVRITFLVSDGLYFGEGPMDVLFDDVMAGPALGAATHLMQHITEKSLGN